MTEAAPCAGCGCTADAAVHALVACLAVDDVDGALDRGLLDACACERCSAACTARLLGERDRRRAALAARDRFRTRQRRLLARAAEREARRTVPPAAGATVAPPLPRAAAAVLQRALARARGAE